MSKLKNWLRTSNGWKRLWFVILILSLLFSIFEGIVQTNLGWTGNNLYATSIYEDYKNPKCEPYINKPLNQLTEPEYDSGCWYIYTHRKYLKEDIYPYTEKMYKSGENWSYLVDLLTWISIYSLISLIGSLLLYGLGLIFNWIVIGFKNTN